MTRLLEQALAEVRKLPEAAQDATCAMILEEIADERRWDEAFARSQDQLARLADRVRQDIRAGRPRGQKTSQMALRFCAVGRTSVAYKRYAGSVSGRDVRTNRRCRRK